MARGGLLVKTSNTGILWGADRKKRAKWYTIVMIEFTDRVTVPDKCKNCPAMAQFAEEYEDIGGQIDELTEAGLSGELREALIAMAIEYDGASEEEAAAIVDRHQAIVMEETSNALDEYDKQREFQATLSQLALKLCHGQLKLQGQADGQRVNAYVCMSDMRSFIPTTPDCEVVTLEREYDEASDDTYEI